MIESLSKKIDVLDRERAVLDGEIESNEALKNALVEELNAAGSADCAQKMLANLTHSTRLIRLQLDDYIMLQLKISVEICNLLS